MRYTFFTLLLSSVITAAPLFDNEPEVRVRIINTLDTLALTLHGEWQIKGDNFELSSDSSSTRFLLFIEDSTLVFQKDVLKIKTRERELTFESEDWDAEIGIADVPYGVGWWWEGSEDRLYSGVLNVVIDPTNMMNVIVQAPLEEYLKGVVPYEIGPDSPDEALMAQAVAARSEAIVALTSGLYGGAHHDLTSDVECQVFSGNHRRNERSDAAVEATASLILTEKGQAINAYYASNCGGHSEKIEHVWPDRPRPGSYHSGQRDGAGRPEMDLSAEWKVWLWVHRSPAVYCNPGRGTELPSWSQKNFRWEREFGLAEISAMLDTSGDRGELKEIKPLARGQSGRVYLTLLQFEEGEIMVDGELGIRQMFSPSLRSACFVSRKKGDSFILKGAGWGHGVGMCQSGAVSMAKNGFTHQTILEHYYPLADITSIYHR